MPDETETWLHGEVRRLGLVVTSDLRLGDTFRQVLLWPEDAVPQLVDAGVMVRFPELFASTLTIGDTGFAAASFPEQEAPIGKALARSLTRSLRRMATVPVHVISRDRTARSDRPVAWSTEGALDAGKTLRQFRDSTSTFER